MHICMTTIKPFEQVLNYGYKEGFFEISLLKISDNME